MKSSFTRILVSQAPLKQQNVKNSICHSSSKFFHWGTLITLIHLNIRKKTTWWRQECRLLSVSLCVCLCWEGLQIITTERSQGQIVINTVKLRADRSLCASGDRERWPSLLWELRCKRGMKRCEEERQGEMVSRHKGIRGARSWPYTVNRHGTGV